MMKLHLAIADLKLQIKNGERSLQDLSAYEATYPLEARADSLMWNALLPQLRAAVEILEGPKRIMHAEDL